jgi:hypothetical protein
MIRHLIFLPLILTAVMMVGCAVGGGSSLENRDAVVVPGDQPGVPTLVKGFESFDFSEIVFVKRKPYSSDHYYTDINNGTAPDRFLPENGIYVYSLKTQQERPVVTAAELPGGKGFIGKISLSFDAERVLFDFRQDPDSGFRIWEVKLDGTGLRQISFAPPDEAEKVARWGKPWHTDDATMSIPRTWRTATSCFLPSGANTLFSAAVPPPWWLRCCTVWRPTAATFGS